MKNESYERAAKIRSELWKILGEVRLIDAAYQNPRRKIIVECTTDRGDPVLDISDLEIDAYLMTRKEQLSVRSIALQKEFDEL
jgi:hypothetical protein